MGKVFHVPRWAIPETDQQTEEHKWTVEKLQGTNYENLDTCLVAMWEGITEDKFHTGEVPWGEGDLVSSLA